MKEILLSAGAVINNPGLLFADEPTGALNKGNTEEVLNLLTTLNKSGQSILMVTHWIYCYAASDILCTAVWNGIPSGSFDWSGMQYLHGLLQEG